ncbi:hypothetical protein JYU34_003429 [Plutella xylostella]|uniref:F-box domain-containing protein n=1 Tax=Plutella xylostella TaxID=51655 RepID=A0ABQ7R009_PLUXY|nr:hypothetical protein JYU34_003429 [Plutella xylostella]
MNLIELPEDVLIIILKELDYRSQYNLSETCSYFQRIMCYRGIVTKCDISRSTLATIHSFKLDLFHQVAENLQELILCAVPDLTKTALQPVIKKLKCLKSLDVTYTNISILDMVDIHKLCSTIKNLSINFTFGKSAVIAEQTLLKCTKMLSKLENLSFVGSSQNLMFSLLPLYLLSEAQSLHDVKFTAIDCDHTSYTLPEFREIFMCCNLSIYLFDWLEKKTNRTYNYYVYNFLYLFKDLEDFEFIMIKRDENSKTCQFYASDVFKPFVKEHFPEEDPKTPILQEKMEDFTQKRLLGNVIMMFFDKSQTTFDADFFAHLLKQIKEYFPDHYNCPVNKLKDITDGNEWSYINVTSAADLHQKTLGCRNFNEPEPLLKKTRTAASSYELQFDSMIKDKHTIKLSINFEFIVNPISLSPASDFLSKVTFLSLTGQAIYASDFFKVLFQGAHRLETLNVEPASLNQCLCSSLIARSLKFCSSLRNFKLVEKCIQYKTMMEGLSECPWLENIHLSDHAGRPTDLGDVSLLIEKCSNMYSLYLQAPITDSTRKKLLKTMNQAKVKYNRPYLSIEVDDTGSGCRRYGPFIDVFNLNVFGTSVFRNSVD